MFSLIALKCKVRILPMRRCAAPLTTAVQPACGPNENIHERKPRLASPLNKLQKHCAAWLLCGGGNPGNLRSWLFLSLAVTAVTPPMPGGGGSPQGGGLSLKCC